jgi:multidrug efflux system membrane fusion protein
MKFTIVRFRKQFMYGFAIVAVIVVAALLSTCSKKTVDVGVSVDTARPLKQELQNYSIFDGVLAAEQSVNLNARVAGYLTKLLFQDGGYVKKGDLLFVIEQDGYLQQVNLNQAIYNEAKIEHTRQKVLFKENATSQAAVDKAFSSLLQAEANLKLAKINYGYTEVRAPFNGLMGRRLVDIGSYIGATPEGTTIATIQKINPLYVYFSINERDLLKFKAQASDDSKDKKLINNLPVYLELQGEKGFPHEGILDYGANLVSTDTGTLQLRGIFDNSNYQLIPGLYARVMAKYGPVHLALLIPNTSVQEDQEGSYVYTLDADNKGRRKNITLGQVFGPMVEVTKGLDDTSLVVINGFIKLSEGKLANPSEQLLDAITTR